MRILYNIGVSLVFGLTVGTMFALIVIEVVKRKNIDVDYWLCWLTCVVLGTIYQLIDRTIHDDLEEEDGYHGPA